VVPESRAECLPCHGQLKSQTTKQQATNPKLRREKTTTHSPSTADESPAFDLHPAPIESPFLCGDSSRAQAVNWQRWHTQLTRRRQPQLAGLTTLDEYHRRSRAE